MRHRQFLWMVPLTVTGFSLLLTGCPSGKTVDPWASAGSKPKVLVSFTPLYSFASAVAGDDAEVKCLLTASGPHTHGDVTGREIELARGCDVFFLNGVGLDDDADGIAPKIQRAAGDKKWNLVSLGDKLDKSWLHKFEQDDLEKGGAEQHEHEHELDPHVWLSIRCAKKMVEGIRDELTRLDPAHAEGYQNRTAAYLAKLDRLEADGRALLAPKQEKWIVSFHDSLGYFAETYGIKIAKSIEIDPGKEPTDDKLNEIIKECQKKNVRVIAVEPQFSSNTSARAIRDALRGLKDKPIDAVFAEIDPLETSDERDLSPDLYEKTIRQNLAELAKALR
jgi:zinc transport system substrate-binding protein